MRIPVIFLRSTLFSLIWLWASRYEATGTALFGIFTSSLLKTEIFSRAFASVSISIATKSGLCLSLKYNLWTEIHSNRLQTELLVNLLKWIRSIHLRSQSHITFFKHMWIIACCHFVTSLFTRLQQSQRRVMILYLITV